MFRFEIMPHESAELAPSIREVIERPAILGPPCIACRRRLVLGPRAPGRNRVGLAGRQLHDVNVRLVNRDIFNGSDFGLIRRPVGNGPLAGYLLEAADEMRVEWRGNIQIHIAAVAGVTAPGQ